MTPTEKTQAFLSISSQFKLGHLVTESFHPKTQNLSELVHKNLFGALDLLQEVDREALHLFSTKIHLFWDLYLDVKKTLSEGNSIYLCGCGATGRLSLVLETLFRQKFKDTKQIVSFMAGGDFALIKSVESFEDNTSYGERQLLELGLGPGDLLIASTEGGETPFVIGATQMASTTSSRSPYFLYCNPDEVLLPLQRSREVIENPRIKKINLTIGPMAISGSTRMQASTVLMLGIGLSLLYEYRDQDEFQKFCDQFLWELTQIPYRKLAPFTERETSIYQSGSFVNYLTDHFLGITILTDTTERSPTFSLCGFENQTETKGEENPPRALSYLFLPKISSSEEAWRKLLWRSPRALEWDHLKGKIDRAHLLGFDISSAGYTKRSSSVPTVDFRIHQKAGEMIFSCEELRESFLLREDSLLIHLILKMLLNAHSTLIMGSLGRYEGNVMTWVRASNNKLIDRSTRYVLELLKKKNKTPSYEEVVLKIFEELENLQEDEPIVLKVVKKFS